MEPERTDGALCSSGEVKWVLDDVKGMLRLIYRVGCSSFDLGVGGNLAFDGGEAGV